MSRIFVWRPPSKINQVMWEDCLLQIQLVLSASLGSQSSQPHGCDVQRRIGEFRADGDVMLSCMGWVLKNKNHGSFPKRHLPFEDLSCWILFDAVCCLPASTSPCHSSPSHRKHGRCLPLWHWRRQTACPAWGNR